MDFSTLLQLRDIAQRTHKAACANADRHQQLHGFGPELDRLRNAAAHCYREFAILDREVTDALAQQPRRI